MNHQLATSQKALLTLGSFIAFLILYLFFSQTAKAQFFSDLGTSISTNEEKIIFKNSNGLQSFEIEYEGTIEVSENDKDITAISPGGFIEINKITFGSRRTIEISYDGSGKLKKEYFEGRSEVPYDPAGKKWLAEILPEIVRTTRIGAESRVKRFYSKAGVDGVLNEIRSLNSSYVQIYYAELLIRKGGLKPSDLQKSLTTISEVIDSDYYLATLLNENSSIFLKDQNVIDAFFQAVTSIESDYYLSTVLQDALKKTKPFSKNHNKILTAIESIGSDYYQAVVINTLLEDDELSSEMIDVLLNTSKNIESDYYQSSILQKALQHKNLSNTGFKTLLNEVANVGSDYYMATIFSELLDRGIKASDKINIINTVSENMDSDYYLATLLSKVYEAGEVSPEISESILQAIENMNSGYYAATVIYQAAEYDGLDSKSLINLIKATHNIDSDFYKAEALIRLSDAVNELNSEEVKNEYRTAVKTIESVSYYGQAMKAID